RFISNSSRSKTSRRLLSQLFHPVEFHAELFAALGGQPVRLLVPRRVFLIKRFDKAVLDESANRSIQRAGAQSHPSAAQVLDIFDEGIAVARFVGQAGQYQ